MAAHSEFLSELGGKGIEPGGDDSLHCNKQKRHMAMQLTRHFERSRCFGHHREVGDFAAFAPCSFTGRRLRLLFEKGE